MYRRTVKSGDRVRHLGQVYAQGSSTATVVGFYYDRDASIRDWIKVRVQPDNPNDAYGNTWDWDRTILE